MNASIFDSRSYLIRVRHGRRMPTAIIIGTVKRRLIYHADGCGFTAIGPSHVDLLHGIKGIRDFNEWIHNKTSTGSPSYAK